MPILAIMTLEADLMATMNVSLPDPMRIWVEAQTKSGRFGNASDYVRDLIRRDQERAAQIAQLRQVVDEAISSGVSDKRPNDLMTEAGMRSRRKTEQGL